MSGELLVEGVISRLDLVLLELFDELSLLLLHLLGEGSVTLSQFVIKALLDGTCTTCGDLRRLLRVSIHLLGDVALVDLAENTGEFADSLVEKREQLVGLEVQVYLKVFD